MARMQAASVLRRTTAVPPSRTVAKCETCAIRSRGFCATIPPDSVDWLTAIAAPTVVPAGRVLIEEGGEADELFAIKSGTVKLFKQLIDGRRAITGFARAGHLLGLAVSDTYSFSAEALDTVAFCRFPRKKLTALARMFPRMEGNLLAIASNELAAAQEQMLLLGRKTARERIASFLIGGAVIASHAGERGATVIDAVDVPMTRADIADYIGLTTETVSRMFTTMAREGIIGIPSASRIDINDFSALRALAAGSA